MNKEKKLKIIIAILAVLLIAVTANLAMRINAEHNRPQVRVYTGPRLDDKKY